MSGFSGRGKTARTRLKCQTRNHGLPTGWLAVFAVAGVQAMGRHHAGGGVQRVIESGYALISDYATDSLFAELLIYDAGASFRCGPCRSGGR